MAFSAALGVFYADCGFSGVWMAGVCSWFLALCFALVGEVVGLYVVWVWLARYWWVCTCGFVVVGSLVRALLLISGLWCFGLLGFDLWTVF